MQLGSSSKSRRNLGAAAKADAIGELLKSGKSSQSGRKPRAAAEADGNGEQQSRKQIDTIREQQLKRMQLGSSSSAQRAVRRRITHVGERGGSS